MTMILPSGEILDGPGSIQGPRIEDLARVPAEQAGPQFLPPLEGHAQGPAGQGICYVKPGRGRWIVPSTWAKPMRVGMSLYCSDCGAPWRRIS